ncbi:LemA family protein [Parabacteroides sp. OttesenSCG-928-G06]|nr:LemA family protein [Parabacteroides sp. OttesenSCG-928-K15]MDL2282488.1 LemA family protein [Parabacteroides sp. OttesenSCG-928-G06]
MELTLTIKLIILLAVLLVLGAIAYNSLIRKRNQVDNAFASIDVMLKKRFDLIPNLVATVQQYAAHEQELFAEITRLRAMDYGKFSESEKQAFDAVFTHAGDRLRVVAENYPELKASENFIQLQRSLNETEEQLSAARRTFNASVTDFNNSVQSFPTNLVATLFGFQCKSLFHIPEHEKATPDVKELFNK